MSESEDLRKRYPSSGGVSSVPGRDDGLLFLTNTGGPEAPLEYLDAIWPLSEASQVGGWYCGARVLRTWILPSQHLACPKLVEEPERFPSRYVIDCSFHKSGPLLLKEFLDHP